MDKKPNKEDDNYQSPPSLQFGLDELSMYGYPYREEERCFSEDFSFSISEPPKYVRNIPEYVKEPVPYFMDKYVEKRETPPLHRQSPAEVFSKNYMGEIKNPGLPPYMKYPPEKSPDVDPYKSYAFGYNQDEEHAIFVNANQYPYIKRRKERRDYLDSLEKKKDVAYQHESRHKHAMKRPRAPSGKFLTKEETVSQGKSQKDNDETK